MTEIAIAATIFNEARGESSAGRQAVKAVIQNREAYICPKEGCGRNHNLMIVQSFTDMRLLDQTYQQLKKLYGKNV